MRVFVSGGTGVIGRRVVPRLIAAGHHVTLGARSPVREPAANANAVIVDLFDAATVLRAVEGHDAVINLATSIPAGFRAFTRRGWRMNDRIRTEGVRNLAAAAAAAGVTRFVQESYGLIYADGRAAWLDEASPLDPPPHTRSGLEAERTAMALQERGVTPVVLRFALLYGPDSVHTIDTIEYVRKGMAAAFGSPDGFLSSLHVDDAAAAVVAALTAPAGIYNIVEDEPVTKREYFGSLAATLGVKPPRFFPPWTWRLAGSVGDSLRRSQRIANRRFRNATGWSPSAPTVTKEWADVVQQVTR